MGKTGLTVGQRNGQNRINCVSDLRKSSADVQMFICKNNSQDIPSSAM